MKPAEHYERTCRPRPAEWQAGFNGRFLPAHGGKEEPVYHLGRWWLLVWDTESCVHLNYCYADDTFHEV